MRKAPNNNKNVGNGWWIIRKGQDDLRVLRNAPGYIGSFRTLQTTPSSLGSLTTTSGSVIGNHAQYSTHIVRLGMVKVTSVLSKMVGGLSPTLTTTSAATVR